MKRFYLMALCISSIAKAHQKPLANDVILSVSGQDYDLAFKLEDTCKDLALPAKECIDFLRKPNMKKCIAERFVPLADFAKKAVNKSKARAHYAIETDAELGDHFYTIDDATNKAAFSAYKAKLIKDRAEVVRKKDLQAVLSKADGVGIEKLAKRAHDNPLLGGFQTNIICSSKHIYCIGATGSKVLSPLWRGAAPKNVKGLEVGRQLDAHSADIDLRKTLETCAASKSEK